MLIEGIEEPTSDINPGEVVKDTNAEGFNLDTLPPHVWVEICNLWDKAHGPYHRGHYIDRYTMYVRGVADALYMDAARLDIAIQFEFQHPDRRGIRSQPSMYIDDGV